MRVARKQGVDSKGDLTAAEVAGIYGAARRDGPTLDEATRAHLATVYGDRVHLLAHQERAVAWMLGRESAGGGGGVLADEPGLGKTLSVLSLIATDRAKEDGSKKEKCGPTLVVTPTRAVRDQWALEAARFWGPGGVAMYEGAPMPYCVDVARTEAKRLNAARLVLCDLGTLRKEVHFRAAEVTGKSYRDIIAVLFHAGGGGPGGQEWRRIVVDEVQDIQGSITKSSGAQVAAQLAAERRWGVSGTPISLGIGGLHALFAFTRCDPYADAHWWRVNVTRPLSAAPGDQEQPPLVRHHRRASENGGSTNNDVDDNDDDDAAPQPSAQRASALAHARAAAATYMWRSRRSDAPSMATDDAATMIVKRPRPTDGDHHHHHHPHEVTKRPRTTTSSCSYGIKRQRHLPTVRVAPEAAEVAATKPALVRLLGSALEAAKTAGFATDRSELSAKDAQKLLSAGAASGRSSSSSSSSSKTASFDALCRSASAVALGESNQNRAAKLPPPAPPKDEAPVTTTTTTTTYVQCDACNKWRRCPPDGIVPVEKDGRWTCADSQRDWLVVGPATTTTTKTRGRPCRTYTCADPSDVSDDEGAAPYPEDDEEASCVHSARSSLRAVLHRVASRSATKAASTAVQLALAALTRASAIQGADAGHAAPSAAAVALLLDASALVRFGVPLDAMATTQRRWGGGGPPPHGADGLLGSPHHQKEKDPDGGAPFLPSGRSSCSQALSAAAGPSSLLVACAVHLEIEHRATLLWDAVARDRLRHRGANHPPPPHNKKKKKAKQGESPDTAACPVRADCFRALRYERSKRRIASAMASHRRLGARSWARRLHTQVWLQIWAFVDGGAGDLVAELVEHSQAYGRSLEARHRSLAARCDLTTTSVGARGSGGGAAASFSATSDKTAASDGDGDGDDADAALTEDDGATLRAMVLAALTWREPTSAAQRKQAIKDWRAGRSQPPAALLVAGLDDDEADLVYAKKAASSDEGATEASEATSSSSSSSSSLIFSQNVVLYRLLARACRITRRIRDVALTLGDARSIMTAGVHEVPLVASLRNWCDTRAFSSDLAADSAVRIADEVAHLVRDARAAQAKAVAAVKAVSARVAAGDYDAIDLGATLRPAHCVVRDALGDHPYETPADGEYEEPPTRAMLPAVCAMPRGLAGHTACPGCRLYAWRLVKNLRRAQLTWPATLALCSLCAARKASTLARAFLVTFSRQDSGLLALIRAACDQGTWVAARDGYAAAQQRWAPHHFEEQVPLAEKNNRGGGCCSGAVSEDDATGDGGPQNHDTLLSDETMRAARRLDQLAAKTHDLLRNVDAAARAARAADDVALASVNFRCATLDVHKGASFESLPAVHAFALETLEKARDDAVIVIQQHRRGAGGLVIGRSQPVPSTLRATDVELRNRIINATSPLSLTAKFAASLARRDPQLLELRAQLRDARRAAAYCNTVSAARGERSDLQRAHQTVTCAACAEPIVPPTQRGDRLMARIAPCAHVACEACVAARGDEVSCFACGEAHGRPWRDQALVDARRDRSHADFGAKIEQIADDVERHVVATGSRCLVFSMWPEVLALVAVSLRRRKVDTLTLQGGRGAPAVLAKFRNGDASTLLMPLRTNNAGLNLSEATHIILVDTGLAPALEVQALARVRRLDSPCETTVHRYVTKDSIEDAIWQLRRSKSDGDDIASLDQSITKRDVFNLLRTMYSAATSDDDGDDDDDARPPKTS